MKFENKKHLEIIGRKIGYVFAYFIFTTFLFFILKYLKKTPGTASYFFVMMITIIIVFIGFILKRILK